MSLLLQQLNFLMNLELDKKCIGFENFLCFTQFHSLDKYNSERNYTIVRIQTQYNRKTIKERKGYAYNDPQNIKVWWTLSFYAELLFSDYLAERTVIESNCPVQLTELLCVLLSVAWSISKAKHSLSSCNTSLMSGLFVGSDETHDIAISNALLTETSLSSPGNFGSTISWIFSHSILGRTQSRTKLIFSGSHRIGGWPVISWRRIIPKLYMSLFLFRIPDLWNLQGKQSIWEWSQMVYIPTSHFSVTYVFRIE